MNKIEYVQKCAGSSFLHKVLSLVAVSMDYSLDAVLELPLWWLFLLQGIGSRVSGLHQLWCMGFTASWHVGSSQTRDQTSVPCIGR